MEQKERDDLEAMKIVDPKELREARNILGFTQLQTGVALGNVRPETISRWERSPKNERLKMRGIRVESTRQLIQAANLLVELYPDNEDQMTFLHIPQRELGDKSPYDAIMQDPPYGLKDVLRLLGRMAEGIPT